METLYWICEYGKIFCGYMFFVFLWPSVIFSGHLKNKGKIYHFSFCVLVQVLLANSVVLGLGLFHILNRWVVSGIYYGVFLVNVLGKMNIRYQKGEFKELLFSIYRLIMGTSGLKQFLYQRSKNIRGWFKRMIREFWDIIRLHLMECMVLLAIVIYGMIYFSYGTFQDFNYGSSDMYVHNAWIDDLLKGKIFGAGVYPEAMHCFIYCLHVLFGLKVYNCMLFLAGVHVAVTLISAYCFFREVFEWKYTPHFVLILFLTLDLMCIQEVYGMSRLQWTIPQEFGMFTQFFCALYLLRYLKSSRRFAGKKGVEKHVWNEDLFLLMMSVAASITIHFYNIIMAFLMCIPFALIFLRRILKKEKFFPLAAAVLCALFIAVTPMIGALVSGIPFQGSIGWALGVMNSDDSQAEEGAEEQMLEEVAGEATGKNAEKNKDKNSHKAFGEKLKDKLSVLYWDGYATLYNEERSQWIICLTGFSVMLWTAYHIMRKFLRIVTRKRQKKRYFSGYIPIAVSSVLLMIVYASPGLGLPQLIAGSRICATEQLLLLAVIIMPIDMVFTLLSRFCMDFILQILSLFAAVGICSFVIMSGSYHGYLYCELSRYNAAIKVTDSIINKFPRFSYTIVSTTDELYHVINDGRHEELLTFIQKVDEEEEYKLPTEYVFLFVEKKPIEYGQSHYFNGPSWLAGEKYVDLYASFASRCPKINASEISEEEAKKEVRLYSRPSLSYTLLESRTILESKAYLWCQNFSKLNPFEVNVYYEDENLVCYYFKQNSYALYNLAIEDWDRMEGIKW